MKIITLERFLIIQPLFEKTEKKLQTWKRKDIKKISSISLKPESKNIESLYPKEKCKDQSWRKQGVY